MSRFGKFANANGAVSVAGNKSEDRHYRFLFVQVVVGNFVDRHGDVRRLCEYFPIPDPEDKDGVLHIMTCTSRTTGETSGDDLRSLCDKRPGLKEHINVFVESFAKKGYQHVDLYSGKGATFSRRMTRADALNWKPYVGYEYDEGTRETVLKFNSESIEAGLGVAMVTPDMLKDLEDAEEDVAIKASADAVRAAGDPNGLLEEEQQLLDETPTPEAS